MVRVVHVMASGERGGGADHLIGLLPELKRLGVSCTAVVSPDGPLAERLEALGIEVRRVQMMRSRLDLAAIGRLRRALSATSASIIHAHGTRAAFFVTLGHPATPMVYTAHGLSYRQSSTPWRHGLLIGAEWQACRGAAQVVSVSQADLEDLRRRRLLPAGAGLHIPNAVDTHRFAPGDRLASRARLGLPADAFVVGTVSRLVPQKAVNDLIDAALACPGTFMLVVGDGPLRSALEAQARPAGDRIRFMGARDDVPEVLRALDVFALSSRWEGEPIALLEAMATGLPCVATSTSGAREIIEARGVGILVNVGSPKALATAFEALRADPDTRQAMGAAGRAATQSWSWDRAAVQLSNVYRSLVSA